MRVQSLTQLEMISWSAETSRGDRFMDASTHTVRPSFLADSITYKFELRGPPGLHPAEVLAAVQGAQVTQVTEPSQYINELQLVIQKRDEELKAERTHVKALIQYKDTSEKELVGVRAELSRAQMKLTEREASDRDNEARLDALKLLGQTIDEMALDKLVQTELDSWLRALDDFNMTSGEASELRQMLNRLAREVYATALVMEDRQKCACLLEALQKDHVKGALPAVEDESPF